MTIVKLADVARAAGVSTAAASVALNHSSTKTIRVTAETALRIQKIAQSLGYVPNISAKRLSGKSARVIGVIMDSHAVPSAFEVLQAITQGALAVGYQVMVSEVHNSIKGVQRAPTLFRNIDYIRRKGTFQLKSPFRYQISTRKLQ